MLQLSKKVEYGLIALRHMAMRPLGQLFTAKELAQEYEIPYELLAKVLQKLARSGIVHSMQGVKGGYALAKPPADVCLKDLVEILEGPLNLVDCLGDPKRCERSPVCVTREIWNDVSQAICKIFSSITLEDMVRRKKEKAGAVAPMYEI